MKIPDADWKPLIAPSEKKILVAPVGDIFNVR